MQQHPVPQNVTGFQFKLIGDMTVKQFAYLGSGTLVAFMLTKLGWSPMLKFPLAFLAFGGGFALAFMPLNDRPLDTWITSFFKNIYSPTVFLWKKSSDIPEVLQPAVTKIPQNTSTKMVGGVSPQTVGEYLRSLPQLNKTPFDEQEEQRLKALSETLKKEYGFAKTADGKTPQTTLSGVGDRLTQETDKLSIATVVSSSQQVFTVQTGNTMKVVPTVGNIKIRPLMKNPQDKKVEDEIKAEIKGEKAPEMMLKKEVKVKKENEEKIEKIVNETAENLTLEKNEPATVHVTLKTPLKTDQIQPATKEAENDLQEKIDQLQKELSSTQEVKTQTEHPEDTKLKDSLKILEEKFAQTLSEKQKIEDELNKARTASASVKHLDNVFVPNQMVEDKKEAVTVKFVPTQMAAKVGVPQPTKANIVSGIVKDQTNDILPNILIEIKDQKGKTQRALKTNKLGQFSIATSLDNGIYTVHFEDPAGIHEFDIIEITLDGKIFPAMEVRAKNQKEAEREKLKEALFGKQM